MGGSQANRKVKIYRWRSPTSVNGNFGDEITITILNILFGIQAETVPLEKAVLIGAGSILDAYWLQQRANGNNGRSTPNCGDLHVWGSGFIHDCSELVWPQHVHVHSLRGRLSAQRLNGREVVLGDPGILASLLVPTDLRKSASVGFIPHFKDFAWVSDVLRPLLPHTWKVINPENHVDSVLKDIQRTEIVVSSSLHGLIAADSFGIPCVWAKTRLPLYGINPDYKFYDYASSRAAVLTGPFSYSELICLAEADLADLATIAARPIVPWQNQIIDACPADNLLS